MVPLGKLTQEERDNLGKNETVGDGGEVKNESGPYGKIIEIAGKKFVEKVVSNNHRSRSGIAHLTRFNLFNNDPNETTEHQTGNGLKKADK